MDKTNHQYGNFLMRNRQNDYFFMKNPDRVFSRNQILDKIWGNKSDIDDRTVDVHIKRLRDTLKISGQESLIKTIRGIGYRLSKD